MELIEIISVAVAVTTAVLSGVWFIVRRFQNTAVNIYRLENAEQEIQSFSNDMPSVKTDIAVLKNDVSSLKESIFGIKSDVSAIKSVIVQKFPKAITMITQKKSPRVLNELGQSIFKQVDGEELLNDNKEFFFKNIDRMNPKTALDVENAANYACIGYTDNDIFNGIKMYVYNAPSIIVEGQDGKKETYDLTLGDICYALSIPLRDMYLKEHPEIIQ